MSSSDYQQRFSGIRRLYGEKALQRIENMHVCIIGVGGVGSWAVEALARSGIGQLTLIDYDVISIGNSNRQLQALASEFGKKKINVLQQRVAEINPECTCNIIDNFINVKNQQDYLSKGYDYIIDAIDSIKFKANIIYYCKRNKIPIITTGGAGGRADPSKITIKDLSRTTHDPLASNVRAKLRDNFGYTRNEKRQFGVECVFSAEHPVYPKTDGTVSYEKPGVHGVDLDCEYGYGASVCVTSMFGFTAASRVISKLLSKTE